jgi:hypothetical protein
LRKLAFASLRGARLDLVSRSDDRVILLESPLESGGIEAEDVLGKPRDDPDVEFWPDAV